MYDYMPIRPRETIQSECSKHEETLLQSTIDRDYFSNTENTKRMDKPIEHPSSYNLLK